MTWTKKTSAWFAATVLLAAMAFGAVQDDVANAEKIMNLSCMACHDLRTIQTQAMDAEGWTAVVNSMIEKGAKVDTPEIPLLAGYLAENFGPLPDGVGKEVVLNKCTVCHDLKRVRQHFASPEEWAETLGAMENEGLMINDEEYAILLRYLARNFR